MARARSPRIRTRREPDLALLDRWRPRTDRSFVVRVVAATLARVRRCLPVSILLCGEAEIAALHGRHLGDPSPTDVLAFELDGGVELAVSVERARREARRRGTTIRAELALYIVHGILHACGFDDTTRRARSRMRAAEATIMRSLALAYAPVDE